MKTTFTILASLLLVIGQALAADEAPEARFPTMTPAEVRAYERDALRRVADLALIPPVLNTSPLPQYDNDKLDYGMTIGIDRTPKGRLWACWVAGGDSPKAFFVLATSDDDGETWSKPRLVVDSHAKNLPRDRSVLVGNLWTDPTGRLWLFFDQSMEMFDGRGGVWASVCDDPDAETPAWSAPRRIWHGVMLNKPTVLSTGEWMLPISLDQRTGEEPEGDAILGPFQGLFPELDPFRGANALVSTDKGATWQRRGAVRLPNPDWIEHMFVERRDKSLWMLARTKRGIMQSTSTDGGRTWAEPSEPPGIRQPNARFFVRRLASGRLLLVKHGDKVDSHEGRVQLSAWLSDDDGKTWQGGLVLDERKGVSYPDGFQAPDDTIFISYDRNRATDGEVLLARFTEADVLAKQLTGPTSKLKILISRPLAHRASSRVAEPAAAAGKAATPPTFSGPTPGTLREISIPTVDISGEAKRHSIVARGTPEAYQGHCDTVLMADGRTMFTAWCMNHAGHLGPLARSDEGGRTWTAPLTTPPDWQAVKQTTPVIHRLTDPEGVERLVVFGGCDFPGNIRRAFSADGGKTWSPMAETGLVGEVAPKRILAFDGGKRLVMWSDRRDPKSPSDPHPVVWQSESFDGGLTWQKERVILGVPGQWAQPSVVRSPDGKQLLMLMRENTRRHNSLFSVSDDDARTWSEPKELPAALTGDRHVMKYAPDGRLVVAMRDTSKTSPTYGHYVAWVGRYEDIVGRREGQYRIKLLHNAGRTPEDKPGTGSVDCGYSDMELLPDGTIVATAYVKYAPGPEQNSVVSTRFTLAETDAMPVTLPSPQSVHGRCSLRVSRAAPHARSARARQRAVVRGSPASRSNRSIGRSPRRSTAAARPARDSIGWPAARLRPAAGQGGCYVENMTTAPQKKERK